MDRRVFLTSIIGALAAAGFADAADAATKKKKKVVKKVVKKKKPAVNAGPGTLLTTRSVGIIQDADEITVPAISGGSKELRVAITDKPIKFKSLVAVYSDGSTQPLVVPATLAVGNDTGWLKLKTPKGATLTSLKAVYTTGLTITGTAHAAFFVR